MPGMRGGDGGGWGVMETKRLRGMRRQEGGLVKSDRIYCLGAPIFDQRLKWMT